jgi:ribosomal protein S12 methylthiotransferase accessory factor
MNQTLRHVQKQYVDGTHRAKSPEETLAIAEPLMETIGVEEVIDITEADRLGIPCFSAFRPRAAWGGVRYHGGKGKDPLEAKVSAMMEAIERYSGEYRRDSMEFASYEEIGVHRALNPEDLILPRPLQPGEKLHWSLCYDLANQEEISVPSNAVFHPYDTLGMTLPLFQSDPNGLACGNVREEAILHGLLEVIDRDAMSRAGRKRSMGRRLDIDLDCPAKEFRQRFESAGIEIHLWLLDGLTGIPTVAAAGDDTVTRDPALLLVGSGTHPDPAIAALRALTDLALRRATRLHGERDYPGRDALLQKAGYERLKRMNHEWFVSRPAVPLSSLNNVSTPFIDDDIRVLLEGLKLHAHRVCVYDLSRTPFPVVRVIVPGLEVSYVNPGRIRKKG